MNLQDIFNEIEKARKEQKMTYEELGKLVNESKSQASRFCKSETNNVMFYRIINYCQALNIDIDSYKSCSSNLEQYELRKEILINKYEGLKNIEISNISFGMYEMFIIKNTQYKMSLEVMYFKESKNLEERLMDSSGLPITLEKSEEQFYEITLLSQRYKK